MYLLSGFFVLNQSKDNPEEVGGLCEVVRRVSGKCWTKDKLSFLLDNLGTTWEALNGQQKATIIWP